MEKFLIFDVDNSLSTLGGDEAIKASTGIAPIRTTGGAKQLQHWIDRLFLKTMVADKHELFEEAIQVPRYEKTEVASTVGLNGIVIDTLSHLFRQDMRILEGNNKSGALEMTDWGKLERMYNQLIATLCNLPVWVIVNCHISFDKDQAAGTFYYAPQLKGSTRETIAEYFDVVAFTKASRDGKKAYTWQTFADASKFGKDRKSLLQPIISQDFRQIIPVYRNSGTPYPKILVIGESGTGKTKALQTINKE